MGPKQIDVTCPCCRTRLTVDVLTRQILRRTAPDAADAPEEGEGALDEGRWDAAQDQVSARKRSGPDKLDQALAEERGKEARLDDLFRKATEKLSKKDEDDR
jgi:hypothetical protein